MSASYEAALVKVLTDDAGVSALVGSRVALNAVAQGLAAPFITYQTLQAGKQRALDGTAGLQGPRIQLEIYGKTAASVKAVRDAVGALDGYRGSKTVGGVTFNIRPLLVDDDTDDYEPPQHGAEKGFHKITVEVVLWHDKG